MGEYRNDPEWQRQQAILLDSSGDFETKLVRTVAAAKAMQQIEQRYAMKELVA